MAKWIITTDPDTGTATIVAHVDGTKRAARIELQEHTEAHGKPLDLWKLDSRTEIEMDITVIEE